MTLLVFYCQTCMDRNLSLAGMPGYKMRLTRYHLFSDAVQHSVANPEHVMYQKLEEDPDPPGGYNATKG